MNKVLILDFGSQYTQLIARKIRELSVYSEIRPYNIDYNEIKDFAPNALILSGGPASVLSENSPSLTDKIFKLGIPILGICYGMQLITKLRKGKLVPKQHSQYGPAKIKTYSKNTIFKACSDELEVWMSHGDSITELPEGFTKLACTSEGNAVASFENTEKKIWGLQFHPEVHHTKQGKTILSNFLELANIQRDFVISSFAKSKIEEIKNTLGNEKVICALSGGVDSSVTANLIHKAVGKNLTCLFVDNGFLRKNEAKEVIETYKSMDLNVKLINASDIFIERIKGISDPEKKRKIIGKTFIEIFEKEKNKIGDINFLAQGTTYPDLIESVSFKGPSVTIKSHHNVGGLPEKMNLTLIEPLKELFKDEVRGKNN